MINEQELVSQSYKYLMEITWERIESGYEYDINFKPYNINLLKKIVSFFEQTEEYEKCAKVQNLINQKNHEEYYENRRLNS